jgi:two-component system chemotaxis response regulator CheB
VTDCPLVVIGASAGGVEALRKVFSDLPATFPGAICLVLHVPAQAPSVLPAILSRAGALAARHAADGDVLHPGVVLIGPPDHHLLVENGCVRLSKGPQENRHRPAVDPLFRSAAAAYGHNVVGVILSGALDDGAAGLAAIKARGGVAVVQSPGDASVPDMPRHALEYVAVDYALPAEEIPGLLTRLMVELPTRPATSPQGSPRYANRGREPVRPEGANHVLAPLTCPDCSGNLWEFREGEILRYHCRIGHSYSMRSLQAAQDEAVERALWAGIRSLEENAVLARRLRKEADARGHGHLARRYDQRVARVEESIGILRRFLERERPLLAPEDEPAAAVPEPN